LVGAVRTLNSLFIPLPEEANLVDTTGGILSREGSVVSERLFEWITYVLLLLLLAVVGLLPQLYLPWVEKLLLLFERIGG
ncbi:MAG: hypothetical protein P8046_13895, partial [Anaerolineales bacterium]